MFAKSSSIRRQSANKLRGVLLSPKSTQVLCVLNPHDKIGPGGCMIPIPLRRPLCMAGKQLKEFNAESIRLGFSQNLEGIEVIPDAMKLPVCAAFHHFSTDPIPKQNIRLMFSLPTFIPKDWRGQMKKVVKTLTTVLLDVTPDTFAVIQKQEGPHSR